MNTLYPGAGRASNAKLVHIGRSDAIWYSTDEINAKLRAAGPARQVGEPLPQDTNQISDDEARSKVGQWKVVVGTGLSEEMGWPKGELPCFRWEAASSLTAIDRHTVPGRVP